MFALAYVSFLSTRILDTKSKLKISDNALRLSTASLGRGDWHITSVCMCKCVCAGCWQFQQYMQLLVFYCPSGALNYEGVSIYVSVFQGISWEYESLPPTPLLFLPQAEWDWGQFCESKLQATSCHIPNSQTPPGPPKRSSFLTNFGKKHV